jgi:MSHA biogenesis protein MshI
MFSLMGKTQKQSAAALVPGPLGLAVATVNMDGERPRLESCDFEPWADGSANEKLLADKVRQFGLTKRPCTTVMELGDYSILSVDAPDVPPNELRAAIRWQIKDLIDFHIDDAIVDVFDAPASGASGRQNSLYVVVSRTATVRERVDQLQGAEANLATIDIPELVLRNLTARLPEDDGGVAFVYLTPERGLVVVTRQNTLYLARTLDIGYEYLRQGLDEEAGLSLEGSSNFDRLVLEVQRSLDYYDRYFVQPPVAGLVLAPTELPIPGLAEYLNQSLGLAVRNLDLAEIIDSEQPLSMQQQSQCLAAIGAALRQEQTTF